MWRRHNGEKISAPPAKIAEETKMKRNNGMVKHIYINNNM
jgi:hypothetical protein